MAPLSAKVYQLDRLRCHTCGKVFTADPPPGVGDKKYDETASSMVAVLHYGTGQPFNRLAHLQENMGIPLPAATQWELVEDAAEVLEPACDEIVRQGAQGTVLHNDDTTMRILDIEPYRPTSDGPGKDGEERTGIFTTGIVSTGDHHPVSIFFTGHKHAGENLATLLARRAEDLPPPIQMCDALSRNKPVGFDTIMANCLAHARRKFVDVVEEFPEECRFLVKTLGKVYKFDAEARERNLSPEDRLHWHQENSGPLMQDLETWLHEQFDQRKVERNSELGKAISYTLRHWSELTLFLRQAGAPLDNNLCERVLKMAIRHRRNSLFYKTANGAAVGDLFMTLIFTAALNKINPFDYLVALQQHAAELRLHPSQWMPWNYRETIASAVRTADAPS
jgi:hypothetical protein